MTGIENSNVKDFLYKFVPKIINNNPLFVKTFGKNFASKRMRQNVLKVFSNKPYPINGYSAYQSRLSKSITFCCHINDIDNILTPEQILNDKVLQENSVHESIHAILQRTKKECKKYNIYMGTGILEGIRNGNVEIGRGLNEGYTEWLCEKLGFQSVAYKELTNFVRLIEAAIGTKKTMELGKGGTQTNLPLILNMTLDETNYLLSLSDQVYISDDNIKTRKKIAILLTNKANENSFDKSQKENIQKYYNQNLYIIESYLQDPLFLDYIKAKDLPQTEESLIKFLTEESIPKLKEQKAEAIISFESCILDKFFIKDLQQIYENDDVSDENLKMLLKINSLLNKGLDNIPEHLKNKKPPLSSLIFKEEAKKVAERYIKHSIAKDTEDYKNGKLNIFEFIKKNKELFEINPKFSRKLLKIFANSITTEGLEDFTQHFLQILRSAVTNSENKEFLKRIANASIYKLQSQDSNINVESTLVFDREKFFDRYTAEGAVLTRFSEDYEFDFTIDLTSNHEYELAMENFLKLQKEVFENNPNAKISILSREIVVQDGKKMDYYKIDKGELLPMKIAKQMDLQFSVVENLLEKEHNPEKHMALIPVKNSVWSNARLFIRRKINEFQNRKEHDIPNFIDESAMGKIIFDTSDLYKSSSLKTEYKVEEDSLKLAENIEKQEGKNILDKKEIEEELGG